MSLDRFGTTFEVKSVEQRIISGHAAAWALDRVGDVIEKTAFRKTLAEKRPSDVAVFIGHKADELPVGVPLEIAPDAHGLFTRVKVFDGPAGDNLLAVAKGLRAAGQTLGLSIGYRVRDARMDRMHGKSVRVLTDIDLIEFSYAARQTVANPAALMTDVKTTGGSMYGVRKKGDAWVVTKNGDDTDASFDSEEAAKAAADTLAADAGKTIYPNALPDSAFLYIAEGGVLDDERKTVPRTLRHFRYRDADGNPDPDALREALAAIPDAKSVGLDDDERSRLATRVRRMLGGADDVPAWKAGAPVDLLTIAYGLTDLAEQIVAEQAHRRALGEDVKAGWRMGTESADAVKALSGKLARLVEHLDLVAAGRDEEALADWWRAQFRFLEVSA